MVCENVSNLKIMTCKIAKSEQIKQLESKLDELLTDLANTEANVTKLDKYSKDLEDAIKKHYCK